ncbi:hypothetical protein ACQ4LE_001940 [Meloidogyne hapla]|uniref:BED-type domain-containing protein n=1 Tax=Meloidogyne hapla TaxID=6305 RepID=A0A1I8BYF8_MELHA
MRAIIWQIGLFQRLEGNKEAICKLCNENKEKKYTFSVNNFTTTNLVYHLKSKHKNTEYYKLYFKLEKEKENKKIKYEINFNNQLLQQIEEQTSNYNESSRIDEEQLLFNNEESNDQQQQPNEQLLQITEQLLLQSNNLGIKEIEKQKLPQNNLNNITYEKIQQSSLLKPQRFLKKDSFSIKSTQDLDTQLKKAKLEYFRTQTLAAEEQIYNLRIQRKLMEFEYEEKMQKKLQNKVTEGYKT